MQAAVHRVIVLMILAAGLNCTYAQTEGRTPVPPKEAPEELGPSTSPTAEEAADKVKAPVATPAVATAAPVDPKTFEIGPEDILLIRVWREPELSQGVQVRPDGKITLPLIGELQAAGLTPDGLKDRITEKLTEFINKPEVMVSVQSVQSRRYYISGEVTRPGTFPLVVPTTVLQALTNAGGFREFANTKKIRILRNGNIIKFNYNDVSKGKNMDQNIQLQSGDHIFVP
jgi:polysaccharide export outer membrane protein